MSAKSKGRNKLWGAFLDAAVVVTALGLASTLVVGFVLALGALIVWICSALPAPWGGITALIVGAWLIAVIFLTACFYDDRRL